MRIRKRAQRAGLRSGLELTIAEKLDKLGVEYEYEKHTLSYQHKVRGMQCSACNSKECFTTRKYTPDFYLGEYNLYIEGKGRWTGANRAMHLEVRESNPEVRIVFIFQYDNWLTKKKVKRYSDWCEYNGYDYSINEIKPEWITS